MKIILTAILITYMRPELKKNPAYIKVIHIFQINHYINDKGKMENSRYIMAPRCQETL
jgi:hypothetical protein